MACRSGVVLMYHVVRTKLYHQLPPLCTFRSWPGVPQRSKGSRWYRGIKPKMSWERGTTYRQMWTCLDILPGETMYAR